MKRERSVSLLVPILVLSILSFFQSSQCAASQSGWVLLSSQKYHNTFYGVDFLDANIGWVVGTEGIILRTSDGGATWTEQASNTAVTLYDVKCIGLYTAVAVGDSGTILRTTDGGGTWVSKPSGTNKRLKSISILSGTTWTVAGYVVSTRTTDGGDSWTSQDCGPIFMGFGFNDASFIDQNTGIGVGDCKATVRSTNGGITWNFVSWDGGSGCPYCVNFESVVCLDAGVAVAVGSSVNYDCEQVPATFRISYNGVTETRLGLSSTNPMEASPAEENSFHAVSFANASIGTAVGVNGSIIRTTDGGLSWSVQTSGTTSALFAVDLINQNEGVAVGEQGVILRTTDGGATWVTQSESVTSVAGLVWLLSANTAVVTGEDRVIYRTTNGGATWVKCSAGPGLSDVAFNEAGIGITVSAYGTPIGGWYQINRSVDGGATWSPVAGSYGGLYGCCFGDPNTCYAIGDGSFMMKSTNAGANWQTITGPDDSIHGLFFTSALTGVVLGYTAVWRTSDGGATWTPDAAGTNVAEAWFTSADTGTAVGDAGKILRTTDGGATWVPQASGTSSNLYGVCFTSANAGTVVGASGTILRTEDGGETWTPQESGTSVDLWNVHFADSVTGMITGAGGTILRTVTGGEVAVLIQSYAAAWARDHVRVTWSLAREALDSEPMFEVYRSGDGGKSYDAIAAPDIKLDGQEYVLQDYSAEPGSSYRYRIMTRELDGESASFEVDVATPALAFSLAQNRPNPFNPSTSIDFTLAAPGTAALEIYDVSGRLVRTLRAGKLPAGAHTLQWDGRNARGKAMPSGVYIYRLNAGKFTASKKMVLLR